MSDLVDRKLRADLDEATKQHMPAMVVTTEYMRATLARITALETALAEAEGRVETARNEAFEEAAKACEAVLGGALEALSRAQDGSIAAVAVRGNVTAARYCAQAIRDMKDRDSPSPPPVV